MNTSRGAPKSRLIAASVLLVAVGLLFALLPYLAFHSDPPQPAWLVTLASMPSIVLVGVGLFGSERVKVAVSQLIPWL